MKAFMVGDYDIFAAESDEDALDAANPLLAATGINDFEIEDVKQLTEKALSERIQKFDDNGFPIIGETISVDELLQEYLKNHGPVAGWLCGTGID